MELFIFAGPNGSGKSTIISEFISKYRLDDFEYINPDIYAKLYFYDVENELERYKKAFTYAEYKRKSAIADGKSIIIETVNSTENKFQFYEKCKNKGYKITVIFVCTQSSEINISRVALRISQGGHGVPLDKIVSRYERSLKNLYKLSTYADVLYLYDNSVDEEAPKLCFYRDEFVEQIMENTPEWVQIYFLNKRN
jgi:predicted ABC-type ATPase